MSHELEQKIQETYKRIEKERDILKGARMLSKATNNQTVLRSNEAKIREGERSLAYFEETLRELQQRKLQAADPARSGSQNPASPRGDRNHALPPTPGSDYGGRGGGQHSPTSPSGSGPAPSIKAKTYTPLDLIKAETPLTSAKISRMLHQLEFKLQVEMQYRKSLDKMAKLYQAEGDKKSRADAESKRIESQKKIHLLETALKRYKNLHILDVTEDEIEADGPPVEGERKEGLRSKPLSGKLQVTLRGARELEHAPINNVHKSSKKNAVDTFVSFKIEGTEQARSIAVRNSDRWNQDFEILIEKANEVEIAIFDQQATLYPVPIGLLWVKINDLVDALRRQKVGIDAGQGGWVTADAMDGSSPHSGYHGPNGDMNSPLGFNGGGSPTMPGAMPGAAALMPPPGQQEGIEAWFNVEPAGALLLQLNFVRETVRKRPLNGPVGLARQAAVRKRKDEVHEMNGHQFIARQFYQLVLCAYCNEFLLDLSGYQCEDCRYACHKKCYQNVVTKCISKSYTGESDAEKLNHRIPHRWDTITNIGTNWCCHCGYMLPLGRKNARRCSECGVTSHANCAHLVPDFCGMSNERANQLLRDMRVIDEMRQRKPKPLTSMSGSTIAVSQRSATTPTPSHASTSTLPEVTIDQLQGGVGAIRLEGSPDPYGRQPQLPSPQQYQDPRYQQQQPQQQPGHYQPVQGPPPGAQSPQRYGYDQQQQMPPPQQQYQQQQPGVRPPYDQQQFQQQPHQRQSSLPSSPQPPQKQYSTPPPGYPAGPVQGSPQAGVRPLPPTAPPQQQQQQQQTLPPPSHPQQAVLQQRSTRKRKVGLDDFNFLAVLGKGNFGKVMLAEEKRTNGLYAIKVLKKEFIIDNDEVESTRSEKRVFLAASRERHPFLLGLHSCFQTETRIYFVMEYVSGGDLMLHIQRKQFSLRQAKFYASEVLLALEYFHANGIIYRDLKLDNILLTLDGHVKVADYGLCKEEMWFGNTTSTFCGTPEFMAPEILLEQRYGRAVDWWAFGVLTYEMLLGQSPFRGDDEDEIFDAILEDEPLYPITMPRDAVSILQKLLTRDPTRRLGSGKGDAEEIKVHPFFKDVNWDDVLNKRIPPPYKPSVNGTADVSNFDEEFTKEQPTLTPVHGQLSSRDQQEFQGFSWVAAWADA